MRGLANPHPNPNPDPNPNPNPNLEVAVDAVLQRLLDEERVGLVAHLEDVLLRDESEARLRRLRVVERLPHVDGCTWRGEGRARVEVEEVGAGVEVEEVGARVEVEEGGTRGPPGVKPRVRFANFTLGHYHRKSTHTDRGPAHPII